VSALSRACLERVKVEVTYRATDDRSKTYLFSPYCLAYVSGELYTIGWSDLRGAVRTLRVDRVKSIRPTTQRFQRPEDFDPEEYVGRGIGIFGEGPQEQVRIEFAAEAARAVKEREWHPTQRIEGVSEVARWVLYHAPHAKVLEPEALRKTVGEHARRAAEAHR
jgi:predicted DNA-binding transcriptional regulator YafY